MHVRPIVATFRGLLSEESVTSTREERDVSVRTPSKTAVPSQTSSDLRKVFRIIADHTNE